MNFQKPNNEDNELVHVASRWNRFLSLAMHHLRQERPVASAKEYGWYIEKTRYHGRPYDLPLAWFVTNGCFADRSGACTMCNFGAGTGISHEMLLWQLDKIMEKVANLPMIYITPLGSMFDDNEVPPDIRRSLFQRLAKTQCRVYGTESRADTITEEKIAEFRDIFGPNVMLQVGLGLETANPYIQRNCINKGLLEREAVSALDILNRYKVVPLVHVLLKPPFLTEAEAIEDALHTVEWAFAHGAGGIVFCMTNLKPYTLAWWLQQRDRYRVPYVWSGLEVMRRMKPEYRKLCTLSGLYSGVTIYQTAYNCPTCTDYIVSELQRFSTRPDPKILDALNIYDCSCRDEWRAALQTPVDHLPERLLKSYELVGREMFGDDWWQRSKDSVVRDLELSKSLWIPDLLQGIY